MLCDVTECSLQSQEVMKTTQHRILTDPRLPRRVAVVTGGAAIGMQVRRVLASLNAAIFQSEQEVLAWLTEGQDQQSVA